MWAMKPMTGTFELSGKIARHGRIDDGKLTDANILRAEVFQFLGEQVCQVELFPGAGSCLLIFGGLRVNLYITQKTVERRFFRRLYCLRLSCDSDEQSKD